jgi:hypothetical protein
MRLYSLVNELQSIAARIAGDRPQRAVGRTRRSSPPVRRPYETFIAACQEKAEEVDGQSI